MPLIFLFALLFSLSAPAAEIIQHYQSVRSLGMGGVYMYGKDDAGVIFHNPAGLRKISGINFTVFNLNLGVNGMQIYNDLQDVGQISGIDSLGPFYGKNVWLGTDAYSALAMPYFGFGVYNNGFASFRLDNPAFPNMNMDFFNGYGFTIGGAVPLGPCGMGLAVKRTVRRGGYKDIGVATLANANNDAILAQFEDEGIGYGMDTGVLCTVDAFASPTISLSWQDVGSTAFTKIKGVAAPERIKDNLTLGVGFEADLPGLGFATGLEYRHITNSQEPLPKKLHLGVELSLLNLDFRAGLYQGYTTYGVGLDLFIFQFDAAMYTVEKGAYAGQTPDNRVQASLSMELGFDPDFKLTDAGGKKRRLKQRR